MKLPSPPAESPLLPWLLTSLKPMSRTKVKEWLRGGKVYVNGNAITQHDYPLKPSDQIEIVHDRRPTAAKEILPILYQDDALIAINKPAGLLSVATDSEKLDTAFVRLKGHLESHREGRPFVVHRLDRETSGILLFARTESARDAMQAIWNEVSKTYLAIVEGVPSRREGVIENYLVELNNLRVRSSRSEINGSKRATSRYRLLKTVGAYSLLEVEIETGRKHQIRVHLSDLGCPIVGDEWYGTGDNPLKRLGLHAWRLKFAHPETGESVEVEAPMPQEWERMVRE